ncbi:hypothetical protein S40285_04681 [Stachybotrys chlorohalonatus IBT 40285]|uniref:Heterokaryon incompatibility domain-containing protein n=1 Tax=Stachybotrys chlorohalonatus (strain IBT 40285) TaxID=1283841 RepID=A0A084R319_STAC4|nr:hypothetical protein S40285_04681 [Stachybotrys chlorohalonata IBT 40285]
MALCTLCYSIPFATLPDSPCCTNFHYVAGQSELIEYMNVGDIDEEDLFAKDAVLGYPWHENLETLKSAAAKSGCPFCLTVQAAAHSWIELYQKATSSSKFYTEFIKDYAVDFTQQRLWLTKRAGKGSGFSVYVRSNHAGVNAWVGVVPLCSIAFTVEAASPLALHLPLRPLSLDSGSNQSLDIVATWLKDCNETHGECSSAPTSLPTRLLEVGSLSDDYIRLVETGAGAMGRYASLSYCWGSSLTLTTTRASRQARLSGIHLSHLPKTFHDAVRATRHIGLRYLWIDSLCIFQDDDEDWARESACMLDVYSNAYVVFAANRASACDGGCFHTRTPRTAFVTEIPGIGKVHTQLVSPSDEVIGGSWEFASEPLSQRAWALQERVLARRVVHYSSRQMYFECNGGMASEDGCKSDRRYCGIASLRRPQAAPDQVRDTWHSVLWSYGSRKLSKATDKLPALSGIAKLVGNALGDEYIAGIWSGEIIRGLSWQGLGGKERTVTEYVGPSWSWASYNGIAASTPPKNWEIIASAKSWQVELENKEDSYGRVKSAWIQVHGPLVQLELSKVSATDREVRQARAGMTSLLRFCTKYSSEAEGRKVTMDYESDSVAEKWREMEVKALILSAYPHYPPSQKHEGEDSGKKEEDLQKKAVSFAYGLVVVPATPGQKKEFKRIGWMFLNGEEVDKFQGEKEHWATITLV